MTVESNKVIIIRRKRPEDSVHLRCGIATRSGGKPVHLDRPAAALTASVIRSLGVVDAFSQFRRGPWGGSAVNPRTSLVSTCRPHRVATISISRSFEPAAVVFSPIVVPVLAHFVEVRPGAHDGIQSDIAPSPKVP
jgi:hypothetical protein